MVKVRAIVDIDLVEREAFGVFLAHDGLDAVDNFFRRIGKIVNDDCLIALIEQFNYGMAANKTGASGDKYAGVFGVLLLAHEYPFLVR